MPTIESERPPINQTAIHVTSGEFDGIFESGKIAPHQRYTITAESAEATDPVAEVPANSEAPQSQEPLRRVGINYVPGEPPLEAYITGSKDDPNRPGMTLYEVIPVNPEDAADFPKVAPQEAIVPSKIEMEEAGKNLAAVQKAQSEAIEGARADVAAAYGVVPSQRSEAQVSTSTEVQSQTPQEKYDAAKKELADFINDNKISELDQHYLEQYAKAGEANYNAQGVVVTKMSYEAKGLAKGFQELFDKKERLLRG